MTHDEIGDFIAARMRKRGYPMTWSNMRCAGSCEMPDVLAYRSQYNHIVFEVKTSRSDFLVDKKKPWRQTPEAGIGTQRVYVTPAGLLNPEKDIPFGWQLWEVHHQKSRSIVKIIKGEVQKKVKHPTYSWTSTEYTFPYMEDAEERKYFHDKSNLNGLNNWLEVIFKRTCLAAGEDLVSKMGNCNYLKELNIYKEDF